MKKSFLTLLIPLLITLPAQAQVYADMLLSDKVKDLSKAPISKLIVLI